VLKSNGESGECGAGTCESIQGIGLCTYTSVKTLMQTQVLQVLDITKDHIQKNPTHYGSPKGGCEADEIDAEVSGLTGSFCAPKCSTSTPHCPTDMPKGDSATPQCILAGSDGKYCGLVCTPSVLKSNGESGECGAGTCESIQGIGLCTYTSVKTVQHAHVLQVLSIKTQLVEANPTHYGNPKGGCEADELAVQVQGVPGSFCSPKCSTSTPHCPTDMPKGDSATPQCILASASGKYCALVCTPSMLKSNGESGECGAGTCASIQGIGLCTYASSEAPGFTATPVNMLGSDSAALIV